MGKDKNAKTKAKAEKAKDKKVKIKKSKPYAELYPKLGADIRRVETEIKTRTTSTHIQNLKTIINEKHNRCKIFVDAIGKWFREPPEDLTVSTNNLEIQYANSKLIQINLTANFNLARDLLLRIEQMEPTMTDKNKINRYAQWLNKMVWQIASVFGHIVDIANIEKKIWEDTVAMWNAAFSLGKESFEIPELVAVRTLEIEYNKLAKEANERLESALKQPYPDFVEQYNTARDPLNRMIAARTDLDSAINALENNQNELHTKTEALKSRVNRWTAPCPD